MDEFLLTPENVQGCLASCGLARDAASATVRELGGGVSNIVLLVEWPGRPERRWVVKQSLEKLRVKDDWRSDRARIFREAESIQALRPVLGDSVLPEVLHIDRENFFFVMTAAPAGSVPWKESLLSGEVDLAVACGAGTLLGRTIRASRADAGLRKRFEDRTVFDQLRIDPYYRTTASRHADVRPALEELMADSWAIQTALVHGDYSPKNMLVRDGKIFLIDFEVIHWGDPAFDSGFLLNHLFLKSLHEPRCAERYFAAVREFWSALMVELGGDSKGDFEAMTSRHLGGLMLARIDGKSPVEYIRDEETRQRVRKIAKRIILERPRSLGEVIAMRSGA